MIDSPVVIGRRISRIRKNKNMTQEKLGEIINLSSNEISNIERAKNSLSYKTLIDLCDAFEVDSCKILCGCDHNDIDQNIVGVIKHLNPSNKELVYDFVMMLYEKENLK